ncbi:MAG: hypothetical protein EU529_01970 [Promethearchaeota archaeon]|nr:MAG: hypothetical protein EU529_01970 [Candidatus Lokiarchaeota archaeon]
MSVSLDLDLIMNKLVMELGSKLYFTLIISENGVVIKSYINEDEFNKAAIAVDISQLYELTEEITQLIGLHAPDFNLIHSDNFYVLSIKILEKVIILLTEDQIDLNQVFDIINKSMKTD